MIALLLAAQLSALPTPADTMGVRLPPNYIAGSHPTAKDIIQQLRPTTPCGAAGRMEASYREPTALYRQGDRPAKLFTRWRDYPDARGCLVSAGLEKDLWVSSRLMPDTPNPKPDLEKDLKIGPPGAFDAPALLLVQTEASPPPKVKVVRAPPPGQLPPQAERTPNLYKVPERCKDAPVKVVDRHGRPVPVKLADLPKGALIYAVDRRDDGCPVLVVAYGTPALDNPNPPPAPPAAQPATREDAPSNKR